MKIRKLAGSVFAGICAAALLLAGCADSSESSDTPKETAETTAQTTKEPETAEEWHQAMLEKSLVSYGNVNRMQEKIKKAQSGEQVNVAYIGGSITEGLTAGDSKCYARLTYEHFAQTYGTGENVQYINAGLSGTPSILGNLRLERDVLSKNPDIVFIEFAVNDGNSGEYPVAYESMVRTLLEQDNDIAVVLLFSVNEEGYSAQDYMKKIGELYQLPMISYADALTYLFDNNQMTWQDFSDDQSHPNESGHALVAEMVDYYFDTVAEQPASDAWQMSAMTVYGDRYMNAKLYEADSLTPDSLGGFTAGSTIDTFTNGWSRDMSAENEPFTLKIKGKFVFLIYKQNSAGNLGTVDITVTGADGETETLTLNAIAPEGWGNPQVFTLVMGVEEQEYDISIQMAEGSEESAFEILGFATV